MVADLCPKVEKCPLFNGSLLKRPQSEETYKNLYCKAGKTQYEKCKRFICSNTYGKTPDFVLPNSTLTIKEIGERMKEKGVLA